MTSNPKFPFEKPESLPEALKECDLTPEDIDSLIKTLANPSIGTPEDVLRSHILTTNAMLLLSLYMLKQEICKRQAITKSVGELMLFMKEMGPLRLFSVPSKPSGESRPKKEEVLETPLPPQETSPLEEKVEKPTEQYFCAFCEHEFSPYSSFPCACGKNVTCCTFCSEALKTSGDLHERNLRCPACLSGFNGVCGKESIHHIRCQSALCSTKGCERCFFKTKSDAWLCFGCWKKTVR
jgi:hypothetical protein